MVEHRELIERLEKLDGPSREMDCFIGYTADLVCEDLSWREKMDRFGIEHCLSAARRSNNVWSSTLPLYTASLDAAVALCERMLPGARWEITTTGHRPGATINARQRGIHGAYAETPAIALLICLLRALEGGNDG